METSKNDVSTQSIYIYIHICMKKFFTFNFLTLPIILVTRDVFITTVFGLHICHRKNYTLWYLRRRLNGLEFVENMHKKFSFQFIFIVQKFFPCNISFVYFFHFLPLYIFSFTVYCKGSE